jgi:hypothetical protein
MKSAEFVSGDLSTGRLFLTRGDGSVVPGGTFIIVRATMTDNSDSTFDVNFDAS